jgi:hypothetical protein
MRDETALGREGHGAEVARIRPARVEGSLATLGRVEDALVILVAVATPGELEQRRDDVDAGFEDPHELLRVGPVRDEDDAVGRGREQRLHDVGGEHADGIDPAQLADIAAGLVRGPRVAARCTLRRRGSGTRRSHSSPFRSATRLRRAARTRTAGRAAPTRRPRRRPSGESCRSRHPARSGSLRCCARSAMPSLEISPARASEMCCSAPPMFRCSGCTATRLDAESRSPRSVSTRRDRPRRRLPVGPRQAGKRLRRKLRPHGHAQLRPGALWISPRRPCTLLINCLRCSYRGPSGLTTWYATSLRRARLVTADDRR